MHPYFRCGSNAQVRARLNQLSIREGLRIPETVAFILLRVEGVPARKLGGQSCRMEMVLVLTIPKPGHLHGEMLEEPPKTTLGEIVEVSAGIEVEPHRATFFEIEISHNSALQEQGSHQAGLNPGRFGPHLAVPRNARALHHGQKIKRRFLNWRWQVFRRAAIIPGSPWLPPGCETNDDGSMPTTSIPRSLNPSRSAPFPHPKSQTLAERMPSSSLKKLALETAPRSSRQARFSMIRSSQDCSNSTG